MPTVTPAKAMVGINSWAPARAAASAAFCTSRRSKYRRPPSRPRAMMPKRTVAERATMTRLWARLPRRSLINILVRRHHGRLCRQGYALARGVTDDRDPWLKFECDFHNHLYMARLTDVWTDPDVSRVGGRIRRGGIGRGAGIIGRRPCRDARIDHQGEAATELRGNRRHDRTAQPGLVLTFVRYRRPRPFARRVSDGIVGIDRPPQVDGSQEQEEKDRRQHGKLDHRLAAVEPAHQYSALIVASKRTVIEPPKSVPMMGVIKVN